MKIQTTFTATFNPDRYAAGGGLSSHIPSAV